MVIVLYARRFKPIILLPKSEVERRGCAAQALAHDDETNERSAKIFSSDSFDAGD